MNVYGYIKNKIRTYYTGGFMAGFQLYDSISKIDFSDISTLYFYDKEHFIKSEYSLLRKMYKLFGSIKNKYTYETLEATIDVDYDMNLNTITDLFRMNFEIKDSFTDGLKEILYRLRQIKGLKLSNRTKEPFDVPFKKKGGSKDVKIFFLYDDYPLEIQFHTPETERMNLYTHGIYEVYRTLEDGSEEKELLRDDRSKLYSMVNIPFFDVEKILQEVFKYE